MPKPRRGFVNTRINREERQLLEAAATIRGRPLSSYVRSAAKRKAREDLVEAGKSEKESQGGPEA